MARTSDNELRARLRGLGLSRAAIRAAWPRWWSEAAEGSPSARAELKFTVARNLGLDARSLFDELEQPRFLWREEARFKRLMAEDAVERAGITSFGQAVGALVLAASQPTRGPVIDGAAPGDLRRSLLAGSSQPLGLADVLALSWASGIPVIHLRVFPWTHKRMAAMTVQIAGRHAVLLAKDASYPAPIAFYLGHELGHIALGQVPDGAAVVDLEDGHREQSGGDAEELAADEFALTLLTGRRKLRVESSSGAPASGSELARTAIQAGMDLRIDPGVIAEIYGYTTGDWSAVNVALRTIYRRAAPVWDAINRTALRELDIEALPADSAGFLHAVMGLAA